jgi:glutamate racemase
MSILKSDNPIAVFDSGIGGLTVARGVVDNLPNESLIYFGDTAHLPYGDKSTAVIQEYTKNAVDFFLENGVKLILIACNSASVAAYDFLQEYIGDRALLVDIIDPVVGFLGKNYVGKQVGLIGTKLTVKSQMYQKKLAALNYNIDLKAVAAPLLVPIIEEGFYDHELIDIALAEYLVRPELKNIDALVLGCTHYPVIKKNIERFYKGNVAIIEASKIVADQVRDSLLSHNLLVPTNVTPDYSFYVSDLNDNFVRKTKMFFGEEVNISELIVL